MKKALEKAVEKIDAEQIYLSIDIDGISAEYAPGTGTPEFFGLTPWDVKELINNLGPSMIGADIVEVNPEYDNGNTAILASRLVQEIIASSH
jgi:agmatinase